MALKNKVQIYSTNNRKKLFLLDKTGLFDPNNNIGGWDNGNNTSGNPRIIDCSVAIALLTLTDNTTVQINVKDATLPFPNLINLPFEINASDCGLDEFVDGYYSIKVFYSGYFPTDPIQFWAAEAASTVFVTAGVGCCVQKLFSKVDTTVSLCKSKEWGEAVNAKTLLEAIWNAIGNYHQNIEGCNNLTAAQTILKNLQYICKNLGCNCGC